jgi:integrase
MAWLEEHPTSGHFKICFRWDGRKLKKTIKTTSRKEAEAALLRFEENVSLLERGRIELPPGADLGTFLLSDGKLAHKPKLTTPPPALTLASVRDLYVQAHANGAVEENSLATIQMHLRHFVITLGESFPIQQLTLSDLQRHVDRRARKKYRGRSLSPVTMRKEMASFRACWNWGVHGGKLQGHFPSRGLKYPKADEKPPFQTWEEIERQIAQGGLKDTEKKALWDCLFLRLAEIEGFLDFVRTAAHHGFVYPMLVFAAHTGARRSEILRARIDDVDFAGGTVLLHEKKRSKGQRTHRRVPLSAFLEQVLRDWVAQYPGGKHLFCHRADVARSKTRRTAAVPLTRNEAHDHFKRTVADSKWARLRGWHVFRHSFVSNCAARGIDQRMIDEWVGHQTEEMRRRYRHLFPDQQRQAIRSVFG